jgi:hypothetical protein
MQINWRFESFAPRCKAALQAALNPKSWLAAAKRKVFQLVTLAINLLLLSVVLVVADHLPFTDIPSSGPLHDAVDAIYGARITNGTTATTYSPDLDVTRGQMAFFLQRGMGRAGFNTSATINLGTTETDLAVITLTTGGVTGGTGFVKLDGTVNSSTQATPTTGCPCELRIQITQDDGSSSDIFFTNLDDGAGGVLGNVNSSATWVVSVPTGTTQTFRLKALFSDSEGTLPANDTYGSMTAIYVPLGSSGNSTAAPVNQELKRRPR